MRVAPSRTAAALRRGSSNARQPASAAALSRLRSTRCAWAAPLRRLQAVRCSPKRSSSALRLRPIVTDREREGRGSPHQQQKYGGGRLGLSAAGSHHCGRGVFRPLPASSCGQVPPWRTSTFATSCPSERQGRFPSLSMALWQPLGLSAGSPGVAARGCGPVGTSKLVRPFAFS